MSVSESALRGAKSELNEAVHVLEQLADAVVEGQLGWRATRERLQEGLEAIKRARNKLI